jgi:hypothetical protein
LARRSESPPDRRRTVAVRELTGMRLAQAFSQPRPEIGNFDFLTLEQPKTSAHRFTCILISARGDELADKLFLMVSQDDVAGCHVKSP